MFLLKLFSKWPPAAILEVPFGPFWMTENHFRSHFSPFQIYTQLLFLLNFFQNDHFGSPICAKNNRVLPLCVINGYAKYEVDRRICDTVRDATSFLAPPAKRQRSFSNADSSVVRRRPSVVNFSIKSLISQKLSDNFFSFLACSFLRMVPMHSKNMDLVESS